MRSQRKISRITRLVLYKLLRERREEALVAFVHRALASHGQQVGPLSAQLICLEASDMADDVLDLNGKCFGMKETLRSTGS